MPVVPATPEHVKRAASIIAAGGVVAFPTETVYGLGANALDPDAVARVFEIKRRPSFDPLIVHVLDDAMMGRVCSVVPPSALTLIERYWPGPLTLVLPKASRIPGIVTSGLPTVAVRMPANAIARALLAACGVPLAAPSANPFGYLSPTRAEHVEKMLGDRVDLILDGGPCEVGVESTIVLPGDFPALLRPGAVPAEEVEAVIGPLRRMYGDNDAPLGPGRLEHHYSPRTPLRIIALEDVPAAERQEAGFLAFAGDAEGYAASRVLSRRRDLREAAAHLFEALHELDDLHLERIDVEPLPEHGLGAAMMDRLRRAATP
jgi:L-threonylcarbamoyladenylate synthase